jgi:sugar lactone lactonase YvrE
MPADDERVRITELRDVRLGWGESLVWDDRRDRLCFVDCAAGALHWLDGGEGALHTMAMSSMPAGVVPTEDGRLLVALDDGLSVVDPDAGTEEHVIAYPPELGGRCHDACADLAGNHITGKLNLGPDEGSAWRWSAGDGWRLLDPAISNTNGPNVAVLDGRMTLVIGDTSADYDAYDADDATGAVGPRRVFGALGEVDGMADGAAFDADGGLWCALVYGSQLARFTTAGLDQTLALPLQNPTDVCFGGPDLDRLFVVAIDGPVLAIDLPGVRGRPEPRVRLST